MMASIPIPSDTIMQMILEAILLLTDTTMFMWPQQPIALIFLSKMPFKQQEPPHKMVVYSVLMLGLIL